MKKLLLLLIAIAMLLSCVAIAEDGDYIPDSEFSQEQLDYASLYKDYSGQGKSFTLAKSITIDAALPEGQTVEDNLWIDYFCLQFGVRPVVEWYAASGDAYNQKVSMCIASDSIPDYMQVNINQWRMLAKSGMLADMTDYYKNNMPASIRKKYSDIGDKPLQAVTYKDQITGYPSINPGADSGSVVWIRTDWLDKLDLAEPTCYEDLTAIIDAFVNQDPDGNGQNDTVGLIIAPNEYQSTGAQTGNTGEMFLCYGAGVGMWMKDDDGEVTYGSINRAAVPCLEQLNAWCEAGLLHPDWVSLGDNLRQDISAGRCGIFFGPWWESWNLADSVVNDPTAVWKSYGFADVDGEFKVGMTDPAAIIGVISVDAPDPEMIWQLMVVGRPEASIRSRKEKAALNAANQAALDAGIEHSFQPFRVIVGTVMCVENNHRYINALHDGTMTWEDCDAEYFPDSGFQTHFDPAYCYDAQVTQYWLNVMERENPYENIGEWSNGMGYGIGVAPMAQPNCVRLYNDFIGQTGTMATKWAYLTTMENEAYTKMILGDTDGMSISEYFDKFVADWLAQGGERITQEVKEALQ
jgi:putative aldouronate transport system substrate-binding protein